MAHVLEGCLLMAPLDSAVPPQTRGERWRTRGATHRWRAHVAALVAWGKGGVDWALAARKEVPEGHPRDVPAFRMRRHDAFWNGQPERMLLAGVERVLPHRPATGLGRPFAAPVCTGTAPNR